MPARIRNWARRLKSELLALRIALADPRTPWYARMAAGFVLGYALCPIDLIPDFIPVLGYLDDIILVPLGIAACLRLIPRAVLDDARRQALLPDAAGRQPSRYGVLYGIVLWLILSAVLVAVALGIAAVARQLWRP